MTPHGSLLEQMGEIDRRLRAEGDARRHFHSVYLRTTRAVIDDATAGRFRDPEWAERWAVVFAELYLEALTAWERGDDPPGPWRVAFQAAEDAHIAPVRHVLLGINAHINYDLPQALLAVISDAELDDDAVIALRAADHAHIDSILVRRVPEEDAELANVEGPGDRSVLDRLLSPWNRAGTRRFLKEARAQVWRNTHILGTARRRGPDAYRAGLATLEALCEERVADLVTPRFVILRLARHGFGVELPETADR